MSLRLRLLLVLLALPHVVVGPLLLVEPVVHATSLAKMPASAEQMLVVAAVLLAVQGLAWLLVLAAPRSAWPLAIVAAVLVLAWIGLDTVFVAQALSLWALSPTLAVLGAAGQLYPVLASSAVLVACVALRARIVTTAVAALVPLAQLAQLALLAAYSHVAWGVWWVWDARTALLLAFHATLVLAAGLGLVRVWLQRRPAQ